MTARDWLILIIRQAVLEQAGEVPTEAPENVAEIFRLAHKHDLAHAVSYYFETRHISVDPSLTEGYKKVCRLAVYREVRQNNAMSIVAGVFQKEHIRFIPLKGATVRSLYPQAWMRTSSDLDILIHEQDLDRAVTALKEAGFQSDGIKRYHDTVLTGRNVCLELHYNICENIKELDSVLAYVWNYTEQVNEYEYRENDAFFVFHHVAHMCYHFNQGGCGVRSLIDLYLITHTFTDFEKDLLPLLERARIRTFYEQAKRLTEVWFEDKPHTAVTASLETYILNGGVFGSDQTFYAVQSNRTGGRVAYVLGRIFPCVSDMKTMYPILNKYPVTLVLLPLMYLHRFIQKTFGSQRKRAAKVMTDYREMKEQDKDTVREARRLVHSVGLDWLL